MASYQCSQCGMGVKALVCAKCGTELGHEVVKKDDGREVHVAKCPKGCGKIKSPMCCGADMACSA